MTAAKNRCQTALYAAITGEVGRVTIALPASVKEACGQSKAGQPTQQTKMPTGCALCGETYLFV